MAVRIRNNGKILCAALNKAMKGDCYINDNVHYILANELKILITTENEYHMNNGGEWWWKGQEPKHILIDEYYYAG